MQKELFLFLVVLSASLTILQRETCAGTVSPIPSVEIHGYVFDAETNAPVEAASVYLAFTLIGSATNTDGYFSIKGIASGSYELIVSRIGYETAYIQIDVRDGTYSDALTIYLHRAVYSLGELEVVAAQSRRWTRRFNLFNKLILGTMVYEEQAEIKNPEVVDFKETRSALLAVARDPLIIENAALGYVIQIQLMGFVWNKRDDILEFTGTAFFEEMEPEDDDEAATWQEHRDHAYTWLVWPHPPERVLKGSCRCRTVNFGYEGQPTCGCYYDWLDG